MRYVEYIYLAAAGMMLVFIILENEYLNHQTWITLLIAILACVIMYLFRRKRRLRIDRELKKEIEQIEQDLDTSN